MDVGEEVIQSLADIDLRQLAASHEGVYDGLRGNCYSKKRSMLLYWWLQGASAIVIGQPVVALQGFG